MYFGDSAYAVNEGGSVEVQVQLSADPERALTILLEATPGAGAGTGDFTVPAQVTLRFRQNPAIRDLHGDRRRRGR